MNRKEFILNPLIFNYFDANTKNKALRQLQEDDGKEKTSENSKKNTSENSKKKTSENSKKTQIHTLVFKRQIRFIQ